MLAQRQAYAEPRGDVPRDITHSASGGETAPQNVGNVRYERAAFSVHAVDTLLQIENRHGSEELIPELRLNVELYLPSYVL